MAAFLFSFSSISNFILFHLSKNFVLVKIRGAYSLVDRSNI